MNASVHARPWFVVGGRGRGRVVRQLYAEGCNATEIAIFFRICRVNVLATLRKKVIAG